MDCHVGITSLLTVGNPLRFFKAKAREVMKKVERLWDPETGVSPRPNRIAQDVKRLREKFLRIVDTDGAIVEGVADRNRHRRCVGPGRSYHEQLPPQLVCKVEDLNLHPDRKKSSLAN